MVSIAYQLYCSRNFPPVADTLKMLAAAGYTEVEGYDGLFNDLAALQADLVATGLAMTSCHVGINRCEDDPDNTLNVLQNLGVKKVFAPYLDAPQRPTDPDGWTAFGARLARALAPFHKAGLTIGWHNHDFECVALSDGKTPLDHILSADPNLMLELDLGWVARAGGDPVDWINRYADRISAAHVKDLAPAGDCADEDGWADVGHGVLDWAAIHRALQAAGIDHYVVEHDNPNDHARFAQRSFTAVSAL